MAGELTRMSAAAIAAAIAGGEVSALEVTDAHLARIGEVDEAVHAPKGLTLHDQPAVASALEHEHPVLDHRS